MEIFIAGIYNIISKLTRETGNSYFSVEEICEIPEREGFCTGPETVKYLNYLFGCGYIKESEGKYGLGDPSRVSMRVKVDGTLVFSDTP